MHFRQSIFFLILGVVLLSACRQDIDRTEHTMWEEPPEVFVNCSVTGVVKDEKGLPLKGVSLTLENYMEVSDDNGVFYFKDVQANQKTAVVKANLDGYMEGTTSFIPIVNNVHLVEIVLRKINFTGNINGLTGGEVQDGDARVEFPANAFVQPNGIPVDGDIGVYLGSYSNGSPHLERDLPGNYIGHTERDTTVALVPFHTMHIEAYRTNHERLYLQSGNTISLELPIPGGVDAAALEEAMLWHFDPETGFWDRSAPIVLSGHTIQGTLDAPGWWVIAAMQSKTAVRVSLEMNNRVAFPFEEIIVKDASTSALLAVGRSGGTGLLEVVVPRGGEVEIGLRHNLQLEQTAFRFEGEKAKAKLLLHPTDLINNIHARMINCEGKVVRLGYYMLKSGEKILGVHPFRQSSNASQDWPMFLPRDSFGHVLVLGGDLVTEQTGVTDDYVFVQNRLFTGDILVCNGGDKTFVRMQRDLEPAILALPVRLDTTVDTSSLVIEVDFVDGVHFVMWLPVDMSRQTRKAKYLKVTRGGYQIESGKNIEGDVSLRLSEVGQDPGTVVKGEFSCSYNENGKKHRLEGQFAALRQ